MSKLLDELIEFAKSDNVLSKIDLNPEHLSSLVLAFAIARKGHHGQVRLNNGEYFIHPYGVSEAFRNLALIDINDFDSYIGYELINLNGIPYDGINEVCLLHDVLEDTSYTVDNLIDLFEETGNGEYFKENILRPLLLVTHDKKVPYDEYIDIVMTDTRSALVKMLDLNDNSNLLNLDKLDEANYNRALRYVSYLYKINNKFHFIERFNKFHKEYYDIKNKTLYCLYKDLPYFLKDELKLSYDILIGSGYDPDNIGAYYDSDGDLTLTTDYQSGERI